MSNSDKSSITPGEYPAARGVDSIDEARIWLAERGIEDIECITPDMAGVARGKMMPSSKFLSTSALALPSSIFMQTISGSYPEETDNFKYPPHDGDLRLKPDLSTLSAVPWESDPTAQVICDMHDHDGETTSYTPRNVLRKVLQAYESNGWKPVVAPEIEFYLVKTNDDPDIPLEPPVGRSGRAIAGGNGYSIAGVNEFDELVDDVYDYSGAQGLEIETLIHEEGAAQLEINLNHGDPLELADQVFMFKRTIREAALKHGMYATFMAKPIEGQPGSAMHVHHSVLDEDGKNIFTGPEKGETNAFFHFIGGLQEYMPNAIAMMAPYVNSYRRYVPDEAAPVNLEWGRDNRTTGIRIPISDPAARRIENRLPGMDCNPYLCIAASLACGYLGMKNEVRPDKRWRGEASDSEAEIAGTLSQALDLFDEAPDLHKVLGTDFARVYSIVKRAELGEFLQVISPWEREHLLLNV